MGVFDAGAVDFPCSRQNYAHIYVSSLAKHASYRLVALEMIFLLGWFGLLGPIFLAVFKCDIIGCPT